MLHPSLVAPSGFLPKLAIPTSGCYQQIAREPSFSPASSGDAKFSSESEQEHLSTVSRSEAGRPSLLPFGRNSSISNHDSLLSVEFSACKSSSEDDCSSDDETEVKERIMERHEAYFDMIFEPCFFKTDAFVTVQEAVFAKPKWTPAIPEKPKAGALLRKLDDNSVLERVTPTRWEDWSNDSDSTPEPHDQCCDSEGEYYTPELEGDFEEFLRMTAEIENEEYFEETVSGSDWNKENQIPHWASPS